MTIGLWVVESFRWNTKSNINNMASYSTIPVGFALGAFASLVFTFVLFDCLFQFFCGHDYGHYSLMVEGEDEILVGDDLIWSMAKVANVYPGPGMSKTAWAVFQILCFQVYVFYPPWSDCLIGILLIPTGKFLLTWKCEAYCCLVVLNLSCNDFLMCNAAFNSSVGSVSVPHIPMFN